MTKYKSLLLREKEEELQNDLLIRTIKGDKTSRRPVWLMRQAGRILPQYRAVRATTGGFKDLLKNPALACEVTIQPVDELGVDAAIIFSDILAICEAMNLTYDMVPTKGPVFPKVITSRADVEQLRVADGVDDIGYTIEAIKLTKQALNGRVPLIGFSGCPWTLFSYMIEGQGSKTFSKAKKMLYAQPEVSHLLLQKITDSIINYVKAQIEAGVNVVQLFDSWAGVLTPSQYNTFAFSYTKQICDALQDSGVPITVFAKGAYHALTKLSDLNCDTIGLDWTIPRAYARGIIGNKKAVQGNLDPCFLYADRAAIKQETIKMINDFGNGRHIVNLGHGVYPDTPLDNVKCFVDTVKNYEIKYS